MLTPGNSPKTKRPAAFGDADLQKKSFASEIGVCGKDFSSPQLDSTELPCSFDPVSLVVLRLWDFFIFSA